ncbi:MAG: hypothetical protein WDA07_13120 [Leucobacter sp.]
MTTVIGEGVVRDAYRRGQRKVVVDPQDIVTPQALDVFDRLGMRLLRAPATPAPPLSTEPGRALSRTLYRRHPGFVPAVRQSNISPVQIPRVAILGAHSLGSMLASLIASTGSATSVMLIDLVPGLAERVAVDLEHARSLTGTSTRVFGGADFSSLVGADVVVVAPESAGSLGPPNLVPMLGETQMTGDAIATYAPDAVVVFAGWPSEAFTTQLQRAGNLAPERVIGTGATIASARLTNALASAANVSPAEVDAIAIGADGNYMCPLSAARVRGRSLQDVLRPAEVNAALAVAADAPGYVQSLRPSKPPAIAPAHAALDVLQALRGARPGPIPVSVMVESCYNINKVVVGVTARLTLNGLQSVVELPLASDELAALQVAADGVRRQTEELSALLAE